MADFHLPPTVSRLPDPHMQTIQIRDMHPGRYLAFDLRHVLDALGPRVLESSWRIRDVCATGMHGDNRLEGLAGREAPIPGHVLRESAGEVRQVIDGEFAAYDSDQTEPWVTIDAVDSSYYLVRSRDPAVLQAVRACFRDVSEYDEADP